MTREEFRGFLSALREVMVRRGQDPGDLEICESLDVAALRLPDGSWDRIKREHVDASGGTALEMAEAIYDVHLEDAFNN